MRCSRLGGQPGAGLPSAGGKMRPVWLGLAQAVLVWTGLSETLKRGLEAI